MVVSEPFYITCEMAKRLGRPELNGHYLPALELPEEDHLVVDSVKAHDDYLDDLRAELAQSKTMNLYLQKKLNEHLDKSKGKQKNEPIKGGVEL